MKTQPFLLSAGISAGAQIVLALISSVGTILLMPELMRGFDPNTGLSPIMGFFSLLSCVGLLCVPFLHGGTGFFYAFLHSRSGEVTTESGALGGAAASAAASLINGLVGILINIVIQPMLMQQMMNGSGMPGGALPPEIAPMMSAGILSGTIGGIIGVCFGVIIAAVIGALGGLLGAFVFKPK
ncbi:MAG: hypothetical protein OHK0052_16040 [Anaerolineales bacterium]